MRMDGGAPRLAWGHEDVCVSMRVVFGRKCGQFLGCARPRGLLWASGAHRLLGGGGAGVQAPSPRRRAARLRRRRAARLASLSSFIRICTQAHSPANLANCQRLFLSVQELGAPSPRVVRKRGKRNTQGNSGRRERWRRWAGGGKGKPSRLDSRDRRGRAHQPPQLLAVSAPSSHASSPAASQPAAAAAAAGPATRCTSRR